MSDGTILQWEEVQRLMLPPNATMLVPPPPEPAEVPAFSAAGQRPDWLDDAFVGDTHRNEAIAIDPAGQQQQIDPGDAALRVAANLITYGAIVEYAQSPRKEEIEAEKADKRRRLLKAEPEAI